MTLAAAASEPTSEAGARQRLPLYLLGDGDIQVDRDGPGLLIRRACRAPLRYPFCRVSRIISGADVEWSGRALAGCMQHGLVVVFLDRHGMPAGYLHPGTQRPSKLAGAIDELLDRPDGLAHYRNWLRAERMRALAKWRLEWLVRGRPLADSRYRELVRRYVYNGEDASTGTAVGTVATGALHALALEHVQLAGARPVYFGLHGTTLDLASDLGGLLSLRFALSVHEGLGASARGASAALLGLLHRSEPDAGATARQVLGRLHRHIAEWLDRWL